MVAVLGAAVAWFLLLRKPPEAYFVPMVITEYGLDGNELWSRVKPLAEHDRDSLKAINWLGGLPSGAGVNAPANTQASQDKTRLLEELNQSVKTYSGQAPLVIYLSAYAVWQDGAVYVLPANVQVDNLIGTSLTLRDIVTAIAASPAPNKLLILD